MSVLTWQILRFIVIHRFLISYISEWIFQKSFLDIKKTGLGRRSLHRSHWSSCQPGPSALTHREARVESRARCARVPFLDERRHQIRAHLRYEGHPLIGDWSVKDSLLWCLWQILEVRWSHVWRWCRNVVWQSFLALLPPWPGPKDQWHWCPCKTQEMWRIEMMTREWHLPKSSHLRSHIRLHLARNIEILLLCFVDFCFVCHAVFGKVLPWPFHRYRLVKCSCHCRPTCAWYCQMPSTWSMQHVLCM